jgi:predicted regulator of Ras-like GTPase activity (Roadblock/LC7/MglB family)/uncharacterized RDD family membrane protein YckC
VTVVDRNVAFIILALMALVAIPAAVSMMAPPDLGAALIPIVILSEFVVYFIAAMVSNPRATIGMAFGTALLFLILRGICAAIGGLIALGIAAEGSIGVFNAWSNPLCVILQVVVILVGGPYLVATVIPDLVGSEQAAGLTGSAKQLSGAIDSSPTGGFVQVFSYEELAGLIKKGHGVEGFIIYSNEGLVVWHDLPVRLNIDVLTAKVLNASVQMGNIMMENGLTKVRRVMVETREHAVFATTLNQNFGLIILFNGRTSPSEVSSRIAVITKSAREFLQWKYPSLPLAAGTNREKLSLESV